MTKFNAGLENAFSATGKDNLRFHAKKINTLKAVRPVMISKLKTASSASGLACRAFGIFSSSYAFG